MKTIAEMIAEAIDKYHKGLKKKILKTSEEVEANTNENNLVAAVVVGGLIEDVNSQPKFITDDAGKIIGYKTPGGADTVFPFKQTNPITKAVDAKFVTNGENLNDTWPDFYKYNVNIYPVAYSGTCYASRPNTTSGTSISGSMSLSASVNINTGIVSISSAGYSQDNYHIQLSGSIVAAGAVVILTEREERRKEQ